MLTPEEEAYIFSKAYVPEHILNLMVPISNGEPFLKEDYLGFARDNWVILVGYPLSGHSSQEKMEWVLKEIVQIFRPEYLWFIGPEIPSSLQGSCRERQTDHYYQFDLDQTKLKPSLEKVAMKASKELMVERGRIISKDHEAIISELLKREKLPSRIRELYRSIPSYVSHSPTAYVLNAFDKNKRLCAFFVVELGSKDFSTYVLGSHSKRYYVPHASDLLFLEMIRLTREQGKSTINLGLGVNEGIRRFKEKWGGIPFLHYEFCELYYGTTRTISLIKSIESKL